MVYLKVSKPNTVAPAVAMWFQCMMENAILVATEERRPSKRLAGLNGRRFGGCQTKKAQAPINLRKMAFAEYNRFSACW